MDEKENDDEVVHITRRFVPAIRCYVSMVTESHDLMPIGELIAHIEDPTEFLREMLDKGFVNVWVSDFTDSVKIV